MLYEDNYLAHHGIKGQRWGIRRFQNEDGTLTEEGKKRYGSVFGDAKKSMDEKRIKKAQTYSSYSQSAYKGAKDVNHFRRQAESEDKKLGEAWEKYARMETESAKAAIKWAEKSDKITGKDTASDLKKRLASEKISDLYTDQLFNEFSRELTKEIQRSKDGNLNKKQVESLFNGVYGQTEFKKQASEKAKNDRNMIKDLEKFDNGSSEEQKELGDRLLKSMDEYNKHEDRLFYDPQNETNFVNMERWLARRIMKKSGTDTSIGSVSKANAEAKEKWNQNRDEMLKRQNEIKKEIDFKSMGNAPIKIGSELAKKQWQEMRRLSDAEKSDKIYAALQKKDEQLKGDWAGVVLRDIGFRDTPENRAIIWPYIIEIWE